MATYDEVSTRIIDEAVKAQEQAVEFTTTVQAKVEESLSNLERWRSDSTSARKQRLSYTPARTPQRQQPSFADLFDGADRTNQIVQRVDQQLDGWLSEFFPSIYSSFKNVPEDALVQIVTGSEQEYVAQRFAQVFTRARDRAFRSASSAKDTAKAEFTRRGFSLPQAVVARAMNQADQQAQDVLAQVNVDILVQDATLRNDLLKFGIERAAQHKQAMLSIALDFAKSWINLPDQELERARVKAQAQASLYQALASYYNVEVAFEQIRLSAASEKLRSDTTLEATSVNAGSNQNAGNAPAALADAVNGLSGIAAAAYSSAGTLVTQIEST